jgi:hypothetical protein
MKLHFALIAVMMLTLSACATNTSKNDTRTWTRLACSGFLQWKDCWDKAHEMCPSGFDIANQEEIRGHQKREVDIACKQPR